MSRRALGSSGAGKRGQRARSKAAPRESQLPREPEPALDSTSGAFFLEAEDIAPPLADSLAELEETPGDPPPEVFTRRARLRYLVVGAVALAGLLSLAGVGKALLGKGAKRAAPTVALFTSQVAALEAKPAFAAPLEAATPEAPTKPAESAAPPDSKVASKAAARIEPKASDPPGDEETLKKQTLSLLNRGMSKAAIPLAREAIATDPADAMSYLYLGSALQDSGEWKAGVEVYCECVRHATRGPVHECRQLGGHR